MNNFDVRDALDALDVDIRVERDSWVDCLCPIHDERKPSFSINLESGRWICRHENLGGRSVLSLVRKVLGLTNPDAIKWLQGNTAVRRTSANELFDQVLGVVKSSPENEMKEWDIRYAELDSDTMADYWFDRGFTETTMREFEVKYDPNWRSIIWPVRDEEQNRVGYVARSLRGGEGPKYIYPKGFQRTLFPLNHYDGNRVILVEGPLDALWLHQAGYNEALAVLGSGLTVNQDKWLRANTRHVVLCFDNDAVGFAAMKQTRERLSSMRVDIVKLPREVKDIQEIPEEKLGTILCI